MMHHKGQTLWMRKEIPGKVGFTQDPAAERLNRSLLGLDFVRKFGSLDSLEHFAEFSRNS